MIVKTNEIILKIKKTLELWFPGTPRDTSLTLLDSVSTYT